MSIKRKSLVAFIMMGMLVSTLGFGKPASAQEPFLGEISMIGFNFAPRGWAFCDGQLFSITQNTALFSLLGTTFGGDGRTTFALPDLRGRVAIHPGSGPGLSPIQWGEKGGEEDVTLTVNQMPSHEHSVIGATLVGNPETAKNQKSKGNNPPVNVPNIEMTSSMTGPTGGGLAHNNMPPFLGIYHIIALQGIFPSRD